MNQEKFNQCFKEYVAFCQTSNWTYYELYKFNFANWLNKKVQLIVQEPQKVLLLCKASQKEDYFPDGYKPKFKGVQFLWKSGKETLKDFIKLEDIDIFNNLAKANSYEESLFQKRGMSYTALSGWIGTLLPKKFVPVPSTDFYHTIKFLFDIEEYPKDGFDFFVRSQDYFKQTKEELKNYEEILSPLYLDKISDYLFPLYPKAPKKRYQEIDWNWITEDFHLFIFREYLKLYSVRNKSKTPQKPSQTFNHPPAPDVPSPKPLEIYHPKPLSNASPNPHVPDPFAVQSISFEKDYLEIHRKQIELGKLAEQIVLDDEVNHLLLNNKKELSKRVEIVSANPILGFDILSKELDGRDKQIEVKAIRPGHTKSFFISANELKKSKELDNYYIYCVQINNPNDYNIIRLAKPNLEEENIFKLECINYKVSFI